MIAIVQAGVLPQLTKRFGDYRTLLIATTASVIGFIGFGFTGAVWMVAIFIILSSLADMAPPLMTAFAANRVGEDQQGVVQGVIASLSSIAAVVAPLAMTNVFERAVSGDGVYLPGAPFLLAAVMILAIVPLILRLRPEKAA